MRVDLRQLRHVLAVARLRSFSHAAQALNISQPALSRSVARFEAQCGAQIFDRTPGGVATTSLGAQILDEAESLIVHADRLESNMHRQVNAMAGAIRFGTGPMVAGLILPDLLARLARERPALRLDVMIDSAAKLLAELKPGRLEFCVTSRSLVPPGGDFELRLAGKARIAFLARREHPLAGRSGLSIADLAAYPIATGSSEDEIRSAVGRREILPSPTITCENFDVLEQVVLGSDVIWLTSPDALRRSRRARFSMLDVTEWRAAVQDLCVVLPQGRMSPLSKLIVTMIVDGA